MVALPLDVRTAVAVAGARLRALRDNDPWEHERRLSQIPPIGAWRTWLLMAGRGFGKTRTGAEWVRDEVMHHGARRVALVAPTAADARDVMIEGESGLLEVCTRYGFRPLYEPSKRRLTFPNGAKAYAYSADEPDRLRGPQHDLGWCDEIAAWRRPETWDNLQFGLRLGENPRQVATTTPKPVKLVRALVKEPTTAVTRGHTDENLANLAPAFRDIIEKYRGTRLGRQELAGELLDDVEGALWSLDMIERSRLRADDVLPTLTRIVVAVDPQAGYSAEGEMSETGIVVAGRDAPGNGYVLADLSGNYLPHDWATTSVVGYRTWSADRIVAESNQGGEMVRNTLRTVDPVVPITLVHASRGKVPRAEPVSALYEQNKVHHVGLFPELEDQMTTYVPDLAMKSPDRMDSLVWAMTDLIVPTVRPARGGTLSRYRR